MARATRIVGRGGWSGAPADSVVLDSEGRRRRHGALTGVRGLAFDLALDDPLMMRGGDALALDDGRLVEVVAAPEALLELRPGSADELARLAWMLGDRHAPIQIVGQKLRLRDDPSLKAVADHLGIRATPIEAPFDPEGGAYAPETVVEEHHHGHACCGGHHHHGHDHHHAHDHHEGCCGGHGHKHQHEAHSHAELDHAAHSHAHSHSHSHSHGEGCCGGGHKHQHEGHGHHHGHGGGGCGCAGKG